MKTILLDTPCLLYDCFFQDPLQPLTILQKQLLKIEQRCESSIILFALDAEILYKSQRYPFYKQNRKKRSKRLHGFFTQAIEYLQQKNYAFYKQNGYEADDIIASLAAQNMRSKHIVVSKDKDFLQLLNKNTQIYDFKNDIFKYEQDFKQKFGFAPDYFVDFQALFGDVADNIAGVKGVGKKAAMKLIQQFHTIENVYTNLHQIRNTKIKDALLLYKEDAFISKELALLKKDLQLYCL